MTVSRFLAPATHVPVLLSSPVILSLSLSLSLSLFQHFTAGVRLDDEKKDLKRRIRDQ